MKYLEEFISDIISLFVYIKGRIKDIFKNRRKTTSISNFDKYVDFTISSSTLLDEPPSQSGYTGASGFVGISGSTGASGHTGYTNNIIRDAVPCGPPEKKLIEEMRISDLESLSSTGLLFVLGKYLNNDKYIMEIDIDHNTLERIIRVYKKS